MKNLFIIFECDAYGTYNTYMVKGMYTKISQAKKDFEKNKNKFLKNNSDNWILNLGEIKSSEMNKMDLGTNILKDITIILSTEDEDFKEEEVVIKTLVCNMFGVYSKEGKIDDGFYSYSVAEKWAKKEGYVVVESFNL